MRTCKEEGAGPAMDTDPVDFRLGDSATAAANGQEEVHQ